jgi:hypothetical protein
MTDRHASSKPKPILEKACQSLATQYAELSRLREAVEEATRATKLRALEDCRGFRLAHKKNRQSSEKG